MVFLLVVRLRTSGPGSAEARGPPRIPSGEGGHPDPGMPGEGEVKEKCIPPELGLAGFFLGGPGSLGVRGLPLG